MFQVILLILVSLLCAGITTDRRDVDHAIAELDEGSSLDWNVQIRNVVQDEANELLIVVLSNPLNEARACHRLAHAIGREAVFRKAKVEQGSHGYGGSTELLLLLDQVRSSHKANGDLVAERGEQLEHFW